MKARLFKFGSGTDVNVPNFRTAIRRRKILRSILKIGRLDALRFKWVDASVGRPVHQIVSSNLLSEEKENTMLGLRLDHVAVAVRDIDAAIERFRAEFGLAVVDDSVNADGTLRMVYLNAGQTMLQLVTPLAPGPFEDFLARRGEGLHHLCFEVDSVDNLAGRNGTGRHTEPATGGRGAKVCFLTEPVHGVVVELTDPMDQTASR